MTREAREEGGVIIKWRLKKLGILHFLYGKGWARTEKQKERYKRFKGEEMHFFTGKIEMIDNRLKSGDSWEGNNLMPVKDVIKAIERNKPFPKNMQKYYNFQLKALRFLIKDI